MAAIFSSRFSSRKEDIIVLAGPAIGPCCYEVDAPVIEAVRGSGEVEELFAKRGTKMERWMFDLFLANRLQLVSAGIPRDNILTTGICTSCQRELFFSHRAARGQDEGRQLSIIMINGRLPGSGIGQCRY
jgi:copper oxidase (laccase) domain-containing protein